MLLQSRRKLACRSALESGTLAFLAFASCVLALYTASFRNASRAATATLHALDAFFMLYLSSFLAPGIMQRFSAAAQSCGCCFMRRPRQIHPVGVCEEMRHSEPPLTDVESSNEQIEVEHCTLNGSAAPMCLPQLEPRLQVDGVSASCSGRDSSRCTEPSFFLLVAILLASAPWDCISDPTGDGGSGGRESNEAVQYLRLTRLVRLIIVIAYMGKELSRIDGHNMQPIVIKFAGTLVVMIHFLACIWWFLGCGDQGCRRSGWIASAIDATPNSTSTEYILSLYWVVTTTTSTGYGDVFPAAPGEKWIAVCFMLVGVVSFGYLLGGVASLFTNTSARLTHYQQLIQSIAQHMERESLPSSLQGRVTSYLDYLWRFRRGRTGHVLFSDLPLSLQSEVAHRTLRETFRRIPGFADLPEPVARAIALHAHPALYLANEIILKHGQSVDSLYLIARGEVLLKDRLGTVYAHLAVGDYFGEAGVLLSMRAPASFVAITPCDVYVIKRHDLEKTLGHYPSTREEIFHNAMIRLEEAEIECKRLRSNQARRIRGKTRKSHEMGQRGQDGAEMEDSSGNDDDESDDDFFSDDEVSLKGSASPHGNSIASISIAMEDESAAYGRKHCETSDGKDGTSCRDLQKQESGAPCILRASCNPAQFSHNLVCFLCQVLTRKLSRSLILASRLVKTLFTSARIHWDMLEAVSAFVLSFVVTFQASFDHSSPVLWAFSYLLDIPGIMSCTLAIWTEVQIFLANAGFNRVAAMQFLWLLFLMAQLPADLVLWAFAGGRHHHDAAALAALIRLNRLLQLASAWWWLSSVQAVHVSRSKLYSHVKIVALLVTLLHAIVCCWHSLGAFAATYSMPTTWHTHFGIASDEMSPVTAYVHALYWAVATMTSTGYGDLHPTNSYERLFSAVSMVIGQIMFGVLLAYIAADKANADAPQVLQRERMAAMKTYLQENGVSAGVCQEVETYMRCAWQVDKGRNAWELYGIAPDSLCDEIRLEIAKVLLEAHPLFQDLDDQLLALACSFLVSQLFLPGQIVLREGDIGADMYFVHRGFLEMTSASGVVVAKLGPKSYFGETGMLFACPRIANVTAVTHTEAFILRRQDVLKIAKRNRKFGLQLRSIQENSDMLSAIRATIVNAEKAATEQQAQGPHPHTAQTTVATSPQRQRVARAASLRQSISRIYTQPSRGKNADTSRPQTPLEAQQLPQLAMRYSFQTSRPRTQPLPSQSLDDQPSSISSRKEANKQLHEEASVSTKRIREGDGLGIEVPRQGHSAGTSVFMQRRIMTSGSAKQHVALESPAMMQRPPQTGWFERWAQHILNRSLLGFVFLPSSPFVALWDMVIIFATVASVAMAYFQAALAPASKGMHAAFYAIEAIHFLSMYLSAHKAYFNDEGLLITDSRATLDHYIRTTFLWDLAATFPLEAVLLPMYPFGSAMFSLLRVNRTLRVRKIVAFFRQQEEQIGVDIGRLRLLKYSVLFGLCLHVIACGWIIVGCFGAEPCHSSSWVANHKLTGKTYTDWYFSGLYWAAATVLSVGYGDIHAHTQGEMVMSIVVMLAGTLAIGYIIASLAASLANADALKTRYREKMIAIRRFLLLFGISHDLITRISDYYKYLWLRNRGIDVNTIFRDVPLCIKANVSVEVYMDAIDRVPLFANKSLSFKRLLALVMKPLLLLENEYIVKKNDPGEEMFFIHKGTVDVVSEDGKQVFASMHGGEFFGEIALVFSCPRTASIRTATKCDLFVLSRADFDQVLKRFPDIAVQVNEEANERFNLVKKRSGNRTSDSCTSDDNRDESGNNNNGSGLGNESAENDDSTSGSDGKVKGPEQVLSDDQDRHKGCCQKDTCSQKGCESGGKGSDTDSQGWRETRLRHGKGLVGLHTTAATNLDCLLFWRHPRVFLPSSLPVRIALAFEVIACMVYPVFLLYVSSFAILDTAYTIGIALCEPVFWCISYIHAHTAFFRANTLVDDVSEIRANYRRRKVYEDILLSLPYELFFLSTNSSVVVAGVCLRLIRCSRVLRVQSIFKLWEDELEARVIILRLARFTVMVLLFIHVLACTWYVSTCLNSSCNWLTPMSGPNGRRAHSKVTLYTETIYWVAATITTTGYGDMHPESTVEKGLSIAVMIVGRALFAFILGNITSTLANADYQRMKFREDFKAAADALSERGVLNFCKSILLHYKMVWKMGQHVPAKVLMMDLPSTLQAEVSQALCREALLKVPCFRDCDAAGFLGAISANFQANFFMAGDALTHIGDNGLHFFILHSGIVDVVDEDGCIVGCIAEELTVCGFHAFVSQEPMRVEYRAQTTVHALVMERADFDAVLSSYPGLRSDLLNSFSSSSQATLK